MLKIIKIRSALLYLDRRYNEVIAHSADKAVYYSKMSIIEYCGWMEMSQDRIIERAMKNKLTAPDLKKLLQDKIKYNYGFDYEKNFRSLLIYALGLKEVEKLEIFLRGQGVFDILKAELGNYKLERDRAAHTMYDSTLHMFHTPSVVYSSFNKTCPVFKSIYSYVCK